MILCYSEFVRENVEAVFNYKSYSIYFRLPHLTVNEIPKSEYHIQTSYVHPLILGLCKFDISIHPHSSNKTGHEDNTNIISGRPDYRIDVYEAPIYLRKYTNSFGEVKPSPTSSNSVVMCRYLGRSRLMSRLITCTSSE
jgi:hypothetical protein